MTDDEVLALKKGDLVEARISGAWRLCAVFRLAPRFRFSDSAPWCVEARRLGRTAGGAVFPVVSKPPCQVRPPRRLPDPAEANVFADYLQDCGFDEAAACLRKAFPLAEGRLEPTLFGRRAT